MTKYVLQVYIISIGGKCSSLGGTYQRGNCPGGNVRTPVSFGYCLFTNRVRHTFALVAGAVFSHRPPVQSVLVHRYSI